MKEDSSNLMEILVNKKQGIDLTYSKHMLKALLFDG